MVRARRVSEMFYRHEPRRPGALLRLPGETPSLVPSRARADRTHTGRRLGAIRER